MKATPIARCWAKRAPTIAKPERKISIRVNEPTFSHTYSDENIMQLCVRGAICACATCAMALGKDYDYDYVPAGQ